MGDKKAEEKMLEINRVLAEVEDDLRKATVNLSKARGVLIGWNREEAIRKAAALSGSVH